MKNLVPLTDEEALAKLGLLEDVAKENEGKKLQDTTTALTTLFLKGEVSPKQYGEYLHLTPSPYGFNFDSMLFRFHMPKKKDREMKIPYSLTA
ncbi:MAG: hypothetical protein AABW47_00950 [Nanoarchaeota archaeon]